MLFADDSAVVAHSAGDIQSESRRTVTQFSLKINIKKTECNTQGEGPCSSNEEFKSHNERILEKTRSRMWTFSTLRGLTAGDDDDDSKRLFCLSVRKGQFWVLAKEKYRNSSIKPPSQISPLPPISPPY